MAEHPPKRTSSSKNRAKKKRGKPSPDKGRGEGSTPRDERSPRKPRKKVGKRPARKAAPRGKPAPHRAHPADGAKRPPLIARVEDVQLGASGLEVSAKDGERYRVTSAVPGDTLRVFPWQSKGAEGELPFASVDHVVTPAKARVSPPCPLVGRCGGCALQEMSYPAQLKAQERALKGLVKELGSSCDVSIAGLDHPFGYRTKLLMPTAGKAGALRFGFNQRHSTRVLAAEGCPVQHPAALALLSTLRMIFDESEISPTSTRGSSGWLHGISIRIDPVSQEGEVLLAVRSRKIPDRERLLPRLLAVPHLATLGLCISPERSSYPFDGELELLSERERSSVSLAGQAFELSLGSFFQTSAQGAELLVEAVAELLPSKMETFADLYGGVGLFCRLFASRWQRAIVAESNEAAAADLKRHIAESGQAIEVLAGKVEAQMDRVIAARPEVALLDPPRRGCHPRVLEGLASIRPKPTIIYVACSSDAFARDARHLLAAGFELQRVMGVDMFPHTTHLEIVGRFSPTK